MTSIFTRHGGGLAQARAMFGEGGRPWLDLSTGINPVAWPGVDGLSPDWQSLPDPAHLAELEATAAAHFGVVPELCCAVPGSELALRLLGKLLDIPGAYLSPCYRTHSSAFAGGRALATFDVPPDEPLALLLANPNNPDGRIIAPEQLMEWHAMLVGKQGWLVVDEAFADATPANSIAQHVNAARHLIVLRSFGKFFGLAGVRLGFVLAPPAIIEALRGLLGEWPLSAAALAIGIAAYNDKGWIVETREALPRRAGRLDALLRESGLQPMGGCPHFRLIECENADAMFVNLAQKGILTRPFDYNPRWLRLGVPAREADVVRLIGALCDG
ncbi:threonine-phosphate decarboxylase CobD [Sphingobium subterraneum]|uniref:threonine-phosphate decarboxylase n=1 Tax=Sphingobium subterraneum TaxID=627688 RepID=A0A841IX22_9SPHN|nr:threonine-phosphate decarboxylase CobD [Sphingobium subterraneum]MBB6122830.1 cobalamin biosynthetic protein CobC [Sphingobium subterraneum]